MPARRLFEQAPLPAGATRASPSSLPTTCPWILLLCGIFGNVADADICMTLGVTSRAWELLATCGVPIVTLLMVIVLQHSQNRDTQSLQIKLNELLLALEEPDDQIIHAGRLGDDELDDLHARQTERAQSP